MMGMGMTYLLHLKAMVSEGLVKAWARCVKLRLCLMLGETPVLKKNQVVVTKFATGL